MFEGSDGGNAQFLFEKELSKILVLNKSDLKFVVVASCHSERTGQIFKKAGA